MRTIFGQEIKKKIKNKKNFLVAGGIEKSERERGKDEENLLIYCSVIFGLKRHRGIRRVSLRSYSLEFTSKKTARR